jgi:hypothetical protein
MNRAVQGYLQSCVLEPHMRQPIAITSLSAPTYHKTTPSSDRQNFMLQDTQLKPISLA